MSRGKRTQLAVAPNEDLFEELSRLWDQANATRPLYNLYKIQPLFTELHERNGLTPWFTGAKETELLPGLPVAQLFNFYQLLLTTQPTPADKRDVANIALVRVAAFAGLQGKTLVELSAARNVERAAELKTALTSMTENYRIPAPELFSRLAYTLYRELTALSPEAQVQQLTPLVSRTGKPQGNADLKQIPLQIEDLKRTQRPALAGNNNTPAVLGYSWDGYRKKDMNCGHDSQGILARQPPTIGIKNPLQTKSLLRGYTWQPPDLVFHPTSWSSFSELL